MGQKLFSLKTEGLVYIRNYLSLSCKMRVTYNFSKSYAFIPSTLRKLDHVTSYGHKVTTKL